MALAKWPDDQKARVKDLYMQGLSAAKIAGLIGNGVSKNAIVGLTHRMGIAKSRPRREPPRAVGKDKKIPKKKPTPAQGKRSKKSKTPELKRTEKTKRHPILSILDVMIESTFFIEPKTILDLGKGQCRFCVTDREPHLFCGERRKAGSPYCPKHTLVAWRRHKRSQGVPSK